MKKVFIGLILSILFGITQVWAVNVGPLIPVMKMSDCSALKSPNLCLDTDDGKLYYYNGTSVVEFSAGAGGDVTSAGDCASGACGDGTSDGGTYYRFYDGTANYLQMGVGGALGANRTFSLLLTAASEQGDILYYSGTAWVPLAHGTAGNPFITGGHGANPSWLALVLAGGTNTFSLTNGTASLDIAAAATLNIDKSLTVQTGTVTLTGNASGSTLTLPVTLTLPTVAAEGDVVVGSAANALTVITKGANNSLFGVGPTGTLGFFTLISMDNTAAQFYDSVAPTKLVKIDPVGVTAGKTATLAFSNPLDATLTFPTATSTLYGTLTGSITSAQLLGSLSDETGTGVAVFATSPTLVTPVLGTPTSGTMTNVTGLPAISSTAYSATTSLQLLGVISDETGTGGLVFANTPTLITPALGAATATSIVVADVTNDNYIKITNNAARAPTASVNEIYPEANIWKVNQNGTESAAVISPTAGQVTITGPTAPRSYAIADRAGTIPIGSAASALTPGASVTLTVGLSTIYTDTVTDNEDQTITFSGAGSAGDEITIIFTTAGTADEVITFHATLVSSTGTLTLGTTAGKFYVIRFISDGSHWYEVSRTAVQT